MAIRNRKPGAWTALLTLAFLISACSGPAVRQTDETAQREKPRPEELGEYRRLLAEAQQLSFTLDFNDLRRAFVESPEYNPHGGAKLPGLPEAYESVEQSNFDRCLEYVDRVLADNYMSLEAHMIGVLCSGRSANLAREDRHRYMVEGLMRSIESTGDGRSQESAYRTISTSELRGFVRLKGLQIMDQSLVYDRAGVYDKMQVRDPESGEEYALYFNVSEQFAHSVEDRTAGNSQ
ncbi:DUF4919 domain-containing protein [Microbulbifer halophilus]|uniref:DUF4919 domain-containing protein n=1 Tax=Microbulbifer halophilus TaxID=453963 RepID=A0ABW5EAK9_9GAMM|nr:DUF4919 domain-containing protein [Microbulbifer halophilus]MCW8127941.1 DUF4919 domain-containing protein [Microbulbifer halophilus]